MFRDEKEAALARAAAADQRAEELEEQVHELEDAIAERDQELARLRPLAEDVERQRLKAEAKAEAQRASEREARDLARARSSEGPSWLSKHRGTLGLVLGIPLIIVAVVFGERACNRHRAETRPGELVDAQVVKRPNGDPALLCLGKVELGDDPDRYRLDLVDPRSGARLKRLVLESDLRGGGVEAASRGRIWLLGRSGELELRALPGLEPAARWGELVQGSPAFRAGLHGDVEVDGWSGAALVTTKSGEQLRIDSASLEVRPIVYKRSVLTLDGQLGSGRVLLESARAGGLFSEALATVEGPNFVYLDASTSHGMKEAARARWRGFPRLRQLGASKSGTVGSVELSELRYSFEGSPRQALHLRRPGNSGGEPVPDSPELIRPAFVVGVNERVLVLPEGGGFIVRHKLTLDTRVEKLLFSRMTADGKLHFTFTTPGHTVSLGYLAGEVVVLAIQDWRPAGAYLLGLDWRDGRERWRYQL